MNRPSLAFVLTALTATGAAADTAAPLARPVQKLTKSFTCPHGITLAKAGSTMTDCAKDALAREGAGPINVVKSDVSLSLLVDRFAAKALVLDASGGVTAKLAKVVKPRATKPVTGSALVFVDDKVFAATEVGAVYKPAPLPWMLFYVTDEERDVPWYAPAASDQPATGYQYVVADGTLKVRCCFAPQKAGGAPTSTATKAAIPPIVTPPVVKPRATP